MTDTTTTTDTVRVIVVKRYTVWLDGSRFAIVERSDGTVTYSRV